MLEHSCMAHRNSLRLCFKFLQWTLHSGSEEAQGVTELMRSQDHLIPLVRYASHLDWALLELHQTGESVQFYCWSRTHGPALGMLDQATDFDADIIIAKMMAMICARLREAMNDSWRWSLATGPQRLVLQTVLKLVYGMCHVNPGAGHRGIDLASGGH